MELAQRRSPGPRALLALLAVAAAAMACSPLYAVRSAAGHASLIARRRSIEKALRDPRTPPPLRAKLAIVAEARRFGFETIGLKRSRDYSTYAVTEGPLTYLVVACPKTSLAPRPFRVPLIGVFPYKGHFRRADAEREAGVLAAEGLDVHIGRASAYNTPLFISDPIPTAVLEDSTGSVVALILHELTHGTLIYRRAMDFSEAVATFVGERGAEQFLAQRYGPDSQALSEFRRESSREREYAAEIEALRAELAALYASEAGEAEKLARRGPLFEKAERRLQDRGFRPRPLNNAVVAAHQTYRGELELMEKAYAKAGGAWGPFLELLRSLGGDPPARLRARLADQK